MTDDDSSSPISYDNILGARSRGETDWLIWSGYTQLLHCATRLGSTRASETLVRRLAPGIALGAGQCLLAYQGLRTPVICDEHQRKGWSGLISGRPAKRKTGRAFTCRHADILASVGLGDAHLGKFARSWALEGTKERAPVAYHVFPNVLLPFFSAKR